jgi:hypothetical protein
MHAMSTPVERDSGTSTRMQLLRDLESIRRVADRIQAAEERWRSGR